MRRIVGFLFGMALPFAAHADDNLVLQTMSGDHLNKICTSVLLMQKNEKGNTVIPSGKAQEFSECLGFVKGVVEVYSTWQREIDFKMVCLPDNVLFSDMAMDAVRYYKASTHKDWNASELIWAALQSNYGCVERGQPRGENSGRPKTKK